jgi:hypothetical protein
MTRSIIRPIPLTAPSILAAIVLAATAVAQKPDEKKSAPHDPPVAVGVARIDVTPQGPIRLNGYAVRKTESTGVAQ